MEPEDPPPKVYGFKEREFKRDNAPSSAVPPPPTARELAIMSGHAALPTRRAITPKPGDPNDVYAVLQNNRSAEQQAGLDQMEIRKIKSRRKRDYWLMLAGGNLLIIGMVAFTRFNAISMLFGLAGVVIFSLSLTWIMWQIVSKY